MTYSDRDVLRTMDFEKMSGAEITAAKAAIQRMALPLADLPTRRFRPDPRGRRIDMRARLAAPSCAMPAPSSPLKRKSQTAPAAAAGDHLRHFRLDEPAIRAQPPLHPFPCTRSPTTATGSTPSPVRHTAAHQRSRRRDPAPSRTAGRGARQGCRRCSPSRTGRAAPRIGEALGEFNREPGRAAVLGQGAIVLFISDGLDRDGGEGLEAAMERLHKSCRRLIWLNPLLRYEGFAPKSLGMSQGHPAACRRVPARSTIWTACTELVAMP